MTGASITAFSAEWNTSSEEKCLFCQTQVEYLGHCVDAMGIHPTEKKITAIKEAPVPTDASQLRAFVPHISTELAPTYHCTSCWKKSKVGL